RAWRERPDRPRRAAWPRNRHHARPSARSCARGSIGQHAGGAPHTRQGDRVSLIGFAWAAGLGNVAGALALVRHSDRSLHAIDAGIAFGAGVMLAVTMIGVLPTALHDGYHAAWFVLAGYLAVHVAQHVVNPHFHYGEETHRVSAATGITALVGLSLHTFFDGVAIASGFLASTRLGLLLFLAVLVHKLP